MFFFSSRQLRTQMKCKGRRRPPLLHLMAAFITMARLPWQRQHVKLEDSGEKKVGRRTGSNHGHVELKIAPDLIPAMIYSSETSGLGGGRVNSISSAHPRLTQRCGALVARSYQWGGRASRRKRLWINPRKSVRTSSRRL